MEDGSMEKKLKQTMIRLSENDLKALLAIRIQTDIRSDNQAIIFAIRWTAKRLEQQGEARAKATDA
jgi:hypothetical protein